MSSLLVISDECLTRRSSSDFLMMTSVSDSEMSKEEDEDKLLIVDEDFINEEIEPDKDIAED